MELENVVGVLVSEEEKAKLKGMIGNGFKNMEYGNAVYVCNACSCDCVCICDCDDPDDGLKQNYLWSLHYK